VVKSTSPALAGRAASDVGAIDVDTPHGLARAHLHAAAQPRGALILGHGAGGGIASRDLVASTSAAYAKDLSVALVEQPYRVAGRRSPAPARQLDAAWTAVVERLGGEELRGLPLIVGGRSAGARVACRTVQGTKAIAVLCLAFPLVPPRRSSGKPAQSRLPELDAVSVPVLIVQGESDPFGMPPARTGREVVHVRGDHSLRSDPDSVSGAVAPWLEKLLGAASRV
jgi:uncharacterized protein